MAQLQSTSITGSLIVTGGITGSFSGSIAAPGSNTQVLFNNSGVISANSGFVYSSGNVGIGTTSPAQKLDVAGQIQMSGTGNAYAILGGIQASWNGDAQYPTLYSTAADRWVMHINPHISYVQNGTNGYTGTTTGATIRFASNPGASTYWDLGVGVNNVGQDKYSLGRGASSFLAVDNAGNIGIGTTSPAQKLHVVGNTAVTGITSTGNRRLSLGILDLNSGGTPNQIRINTTIPFNSPSADFTVNIKGFRYGAPQMVSLSIGWHYYLSSFYNETAISNGAWKPTISLAQDAGGYVVIHLSSPAYWPKLYVESVYSSAYGDVYSSGWNWTDADLSNCTNVEVVPYQALATDITGNAGSTSAVSGTTNYVSKFTSATAIGNSQIFDNGTNVGIGTTSPGQKLHVDGTVITTSTLNSTAGSYAIDHPGINTWKIGVTSTNSSTFHIGNDTGGSFASKILNITAAGDVAVGTTAALLNTSGRGNITINGSNAAILTLANGGVWKSYFFNDGTNTIIGAQNDFYVSTNAGSTNVLFANSAGNVGIGTTSPNAKLHIAANALGTSAGDSVLNSIHFNSNGNGEELEIKSVRTSNGNDWTHGGKRIQLRIDSTYMGYMQFNGTDNQAGISFGTGTTVTAPGNVTERMRITNGGNVGIGITNPGKRLVVAGNGISTISIGDAGFTDYAGISLNGTLDGGNYNILSSPTDLTLFINRPSGNDIRFRENNINQVTILTGGNVGIGETTPTAKLHIAGSGGDQAPLLRLVGSASDLFNWASSTMHANLTSGENVIHLIGKAQNTNNSGYLGYRHVSDGSASNMLTLGLYAADNLVNILANGNVGIGTTSPSAALDVRSKASSGATNAPTFRAFGLDTDSYFQVNNNSNNSADITLTRSDSATMFSIDGHSGTTYFAGNVGIGTTTPSQLLHVNGRTLVDQFQYTKAINYTSGDLNNLVTAGFYDGSSMSNAPNSGWFWVTVETYSGDNNWIHQTATSFGSLNTANEVYTRVRSGGTWGAWKLLGDAGSISGTTNYVAKFTSGTAIGNSQIFDNGTNVGIGTTSPGAKLEVVGSFRATTKSFLIDHPTKEGKKLQYGVLEGPEHSVYVRGKLTNTSRIELPDYWHALVDENSITVNLTAIGKRQELWVEEITDKYIMVGSETAIVNCFYTVFAERKDVEKLVTEFDKE